MDFPGYLRQTRFLNGYLLVFGSLFLLSQVIIVWLLGAVGLKLLTLQTTYTKAGFVSMVSAWGPAEFEKLRAHYLFDMFHPVWYALFLSAALSKLFNVNSISKSSNVVIWTPIIAGLCDCVENAIHAPFVYDVYSMSQPWIFMGAFFATVKWLLAAGATIAILGLCGWYWLGRLSQSRRT